MSETTREIAYIIKPSEFSIQPLASGDPFPIKYSANAWWMERGKVYSLLVAFRFGANIKQACQFSGITADQWKYFNEVHPEFSTLKERISTVMTIMAGVAVNNAIANGNARMAWRWLVCKRPEEFGSPSERLYWAKRTGDEERREENTVHMTQQDVDVLAEKLRIIVDQDFGFLREENIDCTA